MWTRTAHCSATLSATISSLASEVPTQAGKGKKKNRCKRAVQHGRTTSGSTMKEPWPKPVDDSQKTRIPARRALHPFPEISAPEVSKSQGVFSRRSLHNKTSNSSSSTVRSGECEADAEEERLFIPIRVRVAYDQRRPRRRRILL